MRVGQCKIQSGGNSLSVIKFSISNEEERLSPPTTTATTINVSRHRLAAIVLL